MEASKVAVLQEECTKIQTFGLQKAFIIPEGSSIQVSAFTIDVCTLLSYQLINVTVSQFLSNFSMTGTFEEAFSLFICDKSHPLTHIHCFI